MFNEKDNIEFKWYQRPAFIWTLVFVVGPFAIPFLIFSPAFSKISKFFISLFLIIITLLPFYFVFLIFNYNENHKEIFDVVKTYFPELYDFLQFLK